MVRIGYIIVKDFADASKYLADKAGDHKYETLVIRTHGNTAEKTSKPFIYVHNSEYRGEITAKDRDGNPYDKEVFTQDGYLTTTELRKGYATEGKDKDFENEQIKHLNKIITFATSDATIVLSGCHLGLGEDDHILDLYLFINKNNPSSPVNNRTLLINGGTNSTTFNGLTPKMNSQINRDNTFGLVIVPSPNTLLIYKGEEEVNFMLDGNSGTVKLFVKEDASCSSNSTVKP